MAAGGLRGVGRRGVGKGRGIIGSAENGHENGRAKGGSGRPVRVLLADDHTMFREGLAGLLSSREGMEVVGSTTNDEGAVELARETNPDAVVMQVQVPIARAKETS